MASRIRARCSIAEPITVQYNTLLMFVGMWKSSLWNSHRFQVDDRLQPPRCTMHACRAGVGHNNIYRFAPHGAGL
eukprot:3964298-Pyramimonas_sp.AAC.1